VKRLSTHLSAICVLTMAMLFVQIGIGSADEWGHHHHYRLTRVTYVDAPEYGACRVGWWQTLRYGHVRPVWGAWCR